MTPQFAAFASKHAIKFVIVLVLLLVLLTAYCSGRKDGKTGEVVKQQAREIKTQEKLGDANTGAADQRVIDATKAVEQKKELTDALETTTDPDRRRVLRGCIIMRQQGRDTSSIPACR
jgi:hypothetical protein